MGLYRSTLKGQLFGQTVDVIHGWVTSGGTSSAQAATLATRLVTQWVGDIMPNLGTDYGLDHCDVVGVDIPTAFGVATSSASGGVIGDAAPAFVVANVELRTGLRGRSFHGRFGMPGVTLGQIDTVNGNNLAAGVVTGFQTAVNNWISNMNGGGLPAQLAVVSTISGGTPRLVPIGTVVTSAVVHAPLGSRVSRKS